MPLWACESRDGGAVAVRLGHASDGARRCGAGAWVEELSDRRRCSGCGKWLPRKSATCLASGRRVGSLPEAIPYCVPCAEAVTSGTILMHR